jgi:2-keto-3-deoxygluconate permease
MRIKAGMEKIPGGLMIVPMFVSATINTFAPEALRIGNFTEALFVDGTLTIIALFLLCSGASIDVRNAKTAVSKGTVLLIVKWLVGAAVGLIAYMFAGTNGLFLGLAPLAIIAAMTNSNGGLYVAIVGEYGKEDDKAAYGLLALNDGPFLTMVALSIFGAMGYVDGFFSIVNFISVLLPIVIGAVLGMIDKEMKEFLTKGSDMLIPFMAFALGMSIDFKAILEGGLSGVLLGIMTVFFTGTAGYFVFKAFRWNPIVGLAEGSTAGNAIATPAAIAAASAAFAGVTELATVQVAASTVTTSILLPIYVSILAKRLEKKQSVMLVKKSKAMGNVSQ